MKTEDRIEYRERETVAVEQIVRLEVRRASCGSADLVDDCLVDADLALWQARERLDDLPGLERGAYAAVIVRNAARARLKQEARQSIQETVIFCDPARRRVVSNAPATTTLRHVLTYGFVTDPEIANALASLPMEQRHVLELYYRDQYTDGEIGELLGVTPDTAKKRRYAAIAAVRRSLSGISETS